MQPKEKFSLKDELFNPKKVHQIGSEIKAVHEAFEQEKFEVEVLEKFPILELKERIAQIRDMFKKYLPFDYVEATNILLEAMPNELDSSKTDDDFGEFINVFPKETFEMLEACSLSQNYHERRLASEGSRPKLPWGKKLKTAYDKPIFLLDNLLFDSTRFVTRSVANHLNDIAKLDAFLVIETLKRWKALRRQDDKEMDFMISHALRTLVKDGNVEALELLQINGKGYGEALFMLNV